MFNTIIRNVTSRVVIRVKKTVLYTVTGLVIPLN